MYCQQELYAMLLTEICYLRFSFFQQELDESYHKKLEEKQNQAEEKTAKKRAKR